MAKTRNIFAVADSMGHVDIKSMEPYQHQELKPLRERPSMNAIQSEKGAPASADSARLKPVGTFLGTMAQAAD